MYSIGMAAITQISNNIINAFAAISYIGIGSAIALMSACTSALNQQEIQSINKYSAGILYARRCRL